MVGGGVRHVTPKYGHSCDPDSHTSKIPASRPVVTWITTRGVLSEDVQVCRGTMPMRHAYEHPPPAPTTGALGNLGTTVQNQSQ